MKNKELLKFAEQCQSSADEIAFKYIKLERKNKRLSVLQNYCDFNVFHTVGLLGWYNEIIDFVNKNGKQIKRKFTLPEFIKFSLDYRIKSLAFEILDFKDFKRIKIKKP